MTFSIFQQAATDNNIVLDEPSIDYIIKSKCDKQGQLAYLQLIKDLAIKTQIDCTGTLIAKWQIKQAVQR
jgi:hypothetical protein